MVKTATTVADVFTVVSATGAAADADSLPAGTLYVDGVADAATVTVSDITGTGRYKWSVTMPTLTAGQIASVFISLTVGGVASHGIVYRAQADTAYALKPTTDGRTLDVSAGGEAGVDWANVGSPTTAVNLSATNIDVDQVVASVSGAVGSVAAGGITAASIAADAIGAAELATDACQKIADVALRRTMASIEASGNGETLSVESLYGLIAAAFEASLASTTLTVRKSDGSTLGTKTLTVDAAAVPVTGIT